MSPNRARARALFARARKAETFYTTQLRRVARNISDILRALTLSGEVDSTALTLALQRYADQLTPWARAVATYMVADVSRRDAKAWKELSTEVGSGLRREIQSAPTGQAMQELMNESVDLITSLPRRAAQAVRDLVVNNVPTGQRSDTLVESIRRLGSRSDYEARRIARTEVARAASVLTETRALHAGSEGYIWRTSMDSNVRDAHAEMEGRYVRWDTPPKLSDGTITHAGRIYNCRCYPEPVLPEDL